MYTISAEGGVARKALLYPSVLLTDNKVLRVRERQKAIKTSVGKR